MRFAVAIATCLVAGVAFADTEITVKPNRIEMGAAAPAEDADAARDTSSSNVTRAQDYNSSRSNRTGLRQPGDDPTLRKRPGRTTHKNDANGPKPSGSRAAPAQDYNSSRSNRGLNHPDDSDDDSDSDVMYDRCERAVGDGVDDDCDGDGVRDAAAPANHNSTRSNRTIN